MNINQTAEVIPAGTLQPLPNNHTATPMSMLDRAVASGASIEVLTKLMDLQERYERNVARRAFDDAISRAKSSIPVITNNKAGHNGKRYADFAALARVVDPILGQFGLSYRFRTTQADRISVTCILSHKDGHAEETTLSGPPDKTGSKNDIQAIGSTLTYLQRYSLKQALGLAASDDDDGKSAGEAGGISAEQVATLNDLLAKSGDREAFLKWLDVGSVEDIPAKDYERATNALRMRIRKAAEGKGAAQ